MARGVWSESAAVCHAAPSSVEPCRAGSSTPERGRCCIVPSGLQYAGSRPLVGNVRLICSRVPYALHRAGRSPAESSQTARRVGSGGRIAGVGEKMGVAYSGSGPNEALQPSCHTLAARPHTLPQECASRLNAGVRPWS